MTHYDNLCAVVGYTDAPTDTPTDAPTADPTASPTDAPTASPTDAPTDEPTAAPTDAPTAAPTEVPTLAVHLLSCEPGACNVCAGAQADCCNSFIHSEGKCAECALSHDCLDIGHTGIPTASPTDAPTSRPTTARSSLPTTAPSSLLTGATLSATPTYASTSPTRGGEAALLARG